MSEFKREERYIVVKLKHLAGLQVSPLRNFLRENRVPTLDCVVVEQDWPEYEEVWRSIERRMTTNQTIDGVPRDDLELVLLHGHSTHESDRAWDRLRALLDAPPRCPVCGYTEQDCREQMDHYLCGSPEPAPANKRAVQPAPVAVHTRYTEPVAPEPHGGERTGYVQTEPKHWINHDKTNPTTPAGRDKFIMNGAKVVGTGNTPCPIKHTENGLIVNFDGYTCYAPGAEPKVVIPERKPKGIHKTDEAMGYYFGWNACIDEVTRLNTK